MPSSLMHAVFSMIPSKLWLSAYASDPLPLPHLQEPSSNQRAAPSCPSSPGQVPTPAIQWQVCRPLVGALWAASPLPSHSFFLSPFFWVCFCFVKVTRATFPLHLTREFFVIFSISHWSTPHHLETAMEKPVQKFLSHHILALAVNQWRATEEWELCLSLPLCLLHSSKPLCFCSAYCSFVVCIPIFFSTTTKNKNKMTHEAKMMRKHIVIALSFWIEKKWILQCAWRSV